jgi:hypothetical protein
MVINKLTGIVVDLCIKIHSKVGPGCFEKVMKRYFTMNYAILVLNQKDN